MSRDALSASERGLIRLRVWLADASTPDVPAYVTIPTALKIIGSGKVSAREALKAASRDPDDRLTVGLRASRTGAASLRVWMAAS